jgi:glycosyltransferase involved in cell wall biosynthesis
MRRILEELVNLGHRVVFIPANSAPLQPYTGQLEQLGITVITSVHGREEFFREAGTKLELAILSRPNVAWLVLEQLRDCAPDCLIAYDTVDLHFVRLSRQADVLESLGESRRAAVHNRRADASRELELALVRGCDLTLTVSETERELLGELVPQALVEVLSNVHETAGWVAPLAARSRVLFVGSFDHHPNRDAVTWLAEDIWPLVRTKCPDAVLDIVGSNPPAEILELAGDGVDVRGWVADLEPTYRTTRVALAPLRFGAGVKGKVGESLSAGVPVVGTPLAFEGMHLRDGVEVLFGAGAQELASHIVGLLTDDVLWHRMSEAGRAAITAQFDPQFARAALRGLLARAAAQNGSGQDARA